MRITRRDTLIATTVLALGDRSARAADPSPGGAADAPPRWIAYPGQLAAYRHARRIALAVERCTYIGYPGNFRQPETQVYFRRIGVAARAMPIRWAGPPGRVRVTVNGAGGSITSRSGSVPAGAATLVGHIDFAQRLPCFFLDAGELSTGPGWEASLDGEQWVPAECFGTDPAVFPDALRSVPATIAVARVVAPAGAVPQRAYRLAPGDSLLLDFVETELGRLRMEASGEGQLTVQVGESIAEASDPDPVAFEQRALPPIALGATPRSVDLPERALRFVRLSATGAATVADVRFDARVCPAEQHGHFRSSDPELDAIWSVAVATLRSNMHDFFLDGIKRDGLVWHDGPLCLPAYERVFFDADLSRQTLVAEMMPRNPSQRDLGIIDSPMYDIVGFAREYLARGDPGFARLYRPRIEEMMAFLTGLQNDRGFVDARNVQPYGFFPDWSATPASGPEAHGAPAYGQMLLAGAFRAAAVLATAWGDERTAARYQAGYDRLRDAIRRAFLIPADGLFCNGLDLNGAVDRRYTSFAQAFAIAFDIAEPREYPRLIAYLNDYRRRPTRFSLSQVIELEAYAKAGRTADALQRLRFAWLPIIKAGYRRFFEDIDGGKPVSAQLGMYDRPYAASLCHAWAGAAPVMAISRGVLGVEALEPGYALCSIEPQPAGLDRFTGAVPTPRGRIEVTWARGRGTVTLPPGTRARTRGKEYRGPTTYRI